MTQLLMWLQVAEAAVTDLRVQGSLLVKADSPLGQHEPHLGETSERLRGREDLHMQSFGKENADPDWHGWSAHDGASLAGGGCSLNC